MTDRTQYAVTSEAGVNYYVGFDAMIAVSILYRRLADNRPVSLFRHTGKRWPRKQWEIVDPETVGIPYEAIAKMRDRATQEILHVGFLGDDKHRREVGKFLRSTR